MYGYFCGGRFAGKSGGNVEAENSIAPTRPAMFRPVPFCELFVVSNSPLGVYLYVGAKVMVASFRPCSVRFAVRSRVSWSCSKREV